MDVFEKENWPLTIKASWWKLLLAIAMLSLILLFGLLMAHSVLAKGLCGLGLLVLIWLYLRSLKITRLFADENGITANSGGAFAKAPVGPIAWEDIIDLRLESISTGRSSSYFLIGDVVNPEKYIPADEGDKRYRQLKKLQKCNGYIDESLIFKVYLNGVNVKREKALEILQTERARHLRNSLNATANQNKQPKITENKISPTLKIIVGIIALIVVVLWKLFVSQK